MTIAGFDVLEIRQRGKVGRNRAHRVHARTCGRWRGLLLVLARILHLVTEEVGLLVIHRDPRQGVVDEGKTWGWYSPDYKFCQALQPLDNILPISLLQDWSSLPDAIQV